MWGYSRQPQNTDARWAAASQPLVFFLVEVFVFFSAGEVLIGLVAEAHGGVACGSQAGFRSGFGRVKLWRCEERRREGREGEKRRRKSVKSCTYTVFIV